MSTLKVVVAGPRGRIGQLVVQAVHEAADLQLVGTLDRGDDPGPALARWAPDVLLDVSLASASRVVAPLAASLGVAPVVGTSGLTAEDIEHIAAACAHRGVGGLLVPNFSLGAVLAMLAAERAARHLPCAAIHEVHHPGKRDSPSGTALTTAARMARAGSGSPAPITSERLEGVLARQIVTFSGPGERLLIEHEVDDRRAYLPGVLLAIRQVRSLTKLEQGLETVLDAGLI